MCQLHVYTNCAETSAHRSEDRAAPDVADSKDSGESKHKFRNMIFGEEAMRISPKEPYTIHRPIRRGHFNVSPQYSAHQVYISLSCLLWREFFSLLIGYFYLFRFVRT